MIISKVPCSAYSRLHSCASYLANNGNDQSLADFLDKHVFTGNAGIEISPTAEDVSGFNTYIESYKAGLPIEEAAVRFKN